MKKKSLTKLLALSLAAMLCTSVSAVSVNSAFATDGDVGAGDGAGATTPETTVAADAFVVEEKAAIRVSEPAGMRFYANIGADLVDDVQSADEFGFLIFPQEYLTYENAGTDDWHVKYTDDVTPYGLYDYVEVSTATTGESVEDVIYQREKDGVWCVNGVLHTVVDETMEFAAIAYYKKGTETVYADFNEDFSRSLSYVAKWAYLNEPTKRDMIETAFDDWFDASEFTIDSGADLQRLSNIVRADNTLAGLNFTLSKTIAVDGSTFTPVPAEFAGTWDWNGRAVLVIADEDPNTDDERAFVSDTYNKKATFSWIDHRNGVAVMSSKLVDGATTKFWSDASSPNYVENRVNETLPVDASVTDVESKEDYVNYTGKSAYITLGDNNGSKSTNHHLAVTTNSWALPSTHGTIAERGALELEAAKELYSSVKFRFYVSIRPNVGGRLYGSSNGGLTETMGYINNSKPYGEGYWFEWTITIDQLIDLCANRNGNVGQYGTNADDWYEGQTATAFNGAYLLPLGRISARLGYQQNLYVGDCVFVK